jgi:hypothetical protein
MSALVGRDGAFPWGAERKPPMLHVALVGESAKARKSTAIGDALKILVQPLMSPPPDDDAPKPFEIVRGSGSGEGFFEAIADRRWKRKGAPQDEASKTMTGRRAIFAIDELGALLAKNRRGQAGNMLDFILEAFDANESWSHRTRARMDAAPLVATNAVAVFLCASTVDFLVDNLTDVEVMSGLVGARPRPRPRQRRSAWPTTWSGARSASGWASKRCPRRTGAAPSGSC